ncbi:MAG: hypothetical protein A3F26_03165 [Candidatus Ryanbacteria bacterium RIFCSPHIGHO2_12_FULL_47_12b]|nr:MAG: hypothetical protein A3C83_02855 [Candidatus Ryanbacteria bacterium RIFCSPHIGHO2_02_FULL_47_25]OGZ52301.1 MAG: hypothetical protein A3F26_03165 [Candidatus Ryanbacteria bacterium RIFCSPHIGHO2_12_FULL_47_12b]
MDEETRKRFDEQAQKLDAIYRSAEQTRRYFLWVLIITVVAIILPLVGLLIAVPSFLSVYSSLNF